MIFDTKVAEINNGKPGDYIRHVRPETPSYQSLRPTPPHPTVIDPNGPDDFCDAHQWNLVLIVVMQVNRVFSSPDQMTRTARQNHCAWIQQAVLIKKMMNVPAGRTTNVAAPTVPVPDFVPEIQPLI
jgi:hypothetical protein